MNENKNLLSIIATIYRGRKYILWITMIVFFGSIVISLLLPVKFKASTTFYIASSDLTKPDLIFGNSNKEMDYFGSDEDLDRFFSISSSNDIISKMNKKFDLYSMYDIDSTKEKAFYNLQLKFNKNFELTKTKYGALKLSIVAKESETASEMANYMRDLLDNTAQQLNKSGQEKMVDALKLSIKKGSHVLESIGDSLVYLRQKYGIYNIKTQSELIASLVAKNESSYAIKSSKLAFLKKHNFNRDTILKLESDVTGLKNALESMTDSGSKSNFNLERFNNGIASVAALSEVYNIAMEKYSENKEKLKNYITIFNTNIPAIHLVEAASPPLIKFSPKRSIIVLASTFLAFIFSFLGVIIFESYKNINWEEIKDDK